MDPNPTDVKPGRPYRSVRRTRQADETRRAVIDAAERLFAERGYAGTTLAAVAEAAGVSVELIYKAFGRKPGLVRAIRERALAGTGAVPAEQRSDALRASEEDPRMIIRGWGALAAEVAPRVAPILLLVRTAAAVDPELESLREELDGERLERMRHNAQALEPHLRPGVDLDGATDALWTYSAPELYELLVLRRGWSAERYGRFVSDGIAASLLRPKPHLRGVSR